MKIAIVRQFYNPFGGAEVFVSRALSALASTDNTVDIIARRWQSASSASLPFRHQIVHPFYSGRTWRDWSFARAVQKFLADHDYDIVQSHERIPGLMIYRAGDGLHREWLKVWGTIQSPTSRFWQRLSPYHRYVCACETAMLEHPALKKVICNSPFIRDQIVAHFPLLRSRCEIIYNGIDLDLFSPNGAPKEPEPWLQEPSLAVLKTIPENHLKLIFVGSGFARKGLIQAIKAVATITHATLIVVGADKFLDRYRLLAQNWGLASRVHFLGAQKNLPPLYRFADALLFPTLYEPFGNVTLEALACGIPVITTPTNGASLLITPEENGYVCPAENLPAIQSAIRALSDKSRRQTMAIAARQSALPYSLTAMGDQLLALYRQCADL